ncbi:MAG: hypothetical protein GY804_09150 [Alphaproteobacteria bacterium]|nr:hypothetical protein [Alphaproteobacteria bacterium]
MGELNTSYQHITTDLLQEKINEFIEGDDIHIYDITVNTQIMESLNGNGIGSIAIYPNEDLDDKLGILFLHADNILLYVKDGNFKTVTNIVRNMLIEHVEFRCSPHMKTI